jgi:DNA repair exonuclease SbcCD ATPase subunit
MTFRSLRFMLAASAPLALAGCAESTTQDDVADAQQDVQEEQQDVAEVQTEAREDIAEEQQDVAETRREAMKPVLDDDAADDINAEQQDVAEAQEEGSEAIAEEQQDVTEAQQDLAKIEQERQATVARDAFAAQIDRHLKAADDKIEQLENTADTQDGAAQEATQQKIDELEAARDKVKEAVDDMRGEELTKWQEHQRHVNTALTELNAKMNQAS